jgi:predicted O-methyltransferase YrrM
MYSKWEQALSAEARINYNDALAKLIACGNHTGVYPDVCYLLFRLANETSVQNVLEMGSGFSTYVLAKTCIKLNEKHITTFESLEEWSRPTLCLLEKHGIDTDFYHVTEQDSGPPVFDDGRQFDLAFVDGHVMQNDMMHMDRADSVLYFRPHLTNAILVFDDAQVPGGHGIPECMEELGRSSDNAVWFNPTGRIDRHQFISFPHADHPLLPLVKECELA